MEFVPHSSFVPQSPLSYSNSYVPHSSPTPKNNEKNRNGGVCYTNNEIQHQQHKTLQNPLRNWSVHKNSRSILKNCSDGRGESQERRQLLTNSTQSLASLSEKKSVNNKQPVQRKETLKTVAFGLTTNLDETVLGKEGRTAATPRDGNKTKTIIFSHEAQSLHKLILDQKRQIDTLHDTVEDLKTEQEHQRVGAREQIEIISALATRLQELEKLKNTGTASIPTISNFAFKNSDKKELPTKSAPTKVDKATSVENIQNNKEDKQNKEISGDLVLHRRNDFLQRLECEMVRNPVFEQRLHSMLRVWSEDSSVPPVVFNKNANNIPQEDEGSCGPSMVMRVTTQRQEIFYSTSPGRISNNVRRFPRAEDGRGGGGQRRNFQREREENNENTKPRIKVVELDEDGEEEKENNENEETNDHHYEGQQTINTMLKNVHRSEQIGTDEAAEFFRPQRQDYEDENDEDDAEEFFGGNDHQQRSGRQQSTSHHNNHQHFDDCHDDNQQHRYPFNRRRKREATSTIRNRYR
uniref:Uncharacterized protein n=1 Tax=Meloidogyne hapla TaxID=6305 RepID=A0A1I8C1J5_MELHA